MKSKLTKFALVAGIMLTLALTFSCSSDDGGGDGNVGGPLIGKWYSQEILDIMADLPPDLRSQYEAYCEYEFKPNGKVRVCSPYIELELDYTATANTITMYGNMIWDYTISDNELTITKRPNQDYGGLQDGTYYKLKK